jgi:Xaa-Pro aminopeptidase
VDEAKPDLFARRQTLVAELAELRCEALAVYGESASDPDLTPFVGDVHLGASLVVVSREGEARLSYLTPMERDEAAATGLALSTPQELDLVRWQAQATEPAAYLAHVLRRSLELAGIAPGRVALAGHAPAGVIWGACAELAKGGWTWVPGNPLLQTVRKRKTAAELAGLRHAAAGTCAAMRGVARLLAAAEVHRNGHPDDGEVLWLEGAPLTVARVRREVGQILAAQGLEQPRGNLVAPGEEGAAPHTAGSPERVLRPSESLVVDLFPKGALFADCTRTFCVGPPPEPLARAFAALDKAHRAAHAGAVPGVRGWDLQEAV